jgi:hypothetical protein
MPDLNPLQSEQEVGLKFNAFMGGFQDLSMSYTIAQALMQYMADMLIQLSLIQQTVKLLESQVAGKIYTGGDIKAIAEKLDNRLSDLYQGIASFQLTRPMQHVQQVSNSAAKLTMASQVLDQNITKLNEVNKHIKTLAPDAAKKYVEKSARADSNLAKVKDSEIPKDKGIENDKGDFKPTKRR